MPISCWTWGYEFTNLLYSNNADFSRRGEQYLIFKNSHVLVGSTWSSFMDLASFQQTDCKILTGAKIFPREPFLLQLSVTGHGSPDIASTIFQWMLISGRSCGDRFKRSLDMFLASLYILLKFNRVTNNQSNWNPECFRFWTHSHR